MSSASPRVPLRLRMSSQPGRDILDGGWWPQSRDLAVELADLVDNLPASSGSVVRALYSPSDWDAAPPRVEVATGTVETEAQDDPHVIHLVTSDEVDLHVLVIPPSLSPDQGEEAMLAASTTGNAHAAEALLRTVTEFADIDPRDHWS